MDTLITPKGSKDVIFAPFRRFIRKNFFDSAAHLTSVTSGNLVGSLGKLPLSESLYINYIQGDHVTPDI